MQNLAFFGRKIRQVNGTTRILMTSASHKSRLCRLDDCSRLVPGVRFCHSAPNWIERFNNATSLYPQTSLYTFLLMRTSTWYLLTAIYTQTISVGPELAFGYLVAKFTGKFRQPLNLAVAAAISHQFPILSQIKASALLGIIHPSPGTGPGTGTGTDTGTNTGTAHATSSSAGSTPTAVEEPPSPLERRLLMFLDWMRGPVDKYGFSLFVAGKINIVLTILITAAALKRGIDVSSLLTSWNISMTLQNGAGAMAAATLTNVILLPIHLTSLIYLSPKVDAQIQEYLLKIKDLQQKQK